VIKRGGLFTLTRGTRANLNLASNPRIVTSGYLNFEINSIILTARKKCLRKL